ncbi:MAG: hypothetical protein GF308_20670 [Candidatus Heimdallarchaeota archaeon]|nr:hypothetical protein [Candidatus Heimdallarchaeota archaeon]
MLKNLVKHKHKKTIQLIFLFLILSGLTVLPIISPCQINKPQTQNHPANKNIQINNVQSYNFSTIGIGATSLSWSELGTFKTSLSQTFNLENKGPVLLILEYSSDGEHPDAPGYTITGSFNDQLFKTTIPTTLLPPKGNDHLVRQIAIPFTSEGRFLNNELELNISASNDFNRDASGTLVVQASSSLLVGDALVIHSYGKFSLSLKPERWEGKTSIGGTKFYSCLQFTIENETLIEQGECSCTLQLNLEGETIIDLTLIDEKENPTNFDINSTTEQTSASVNFQPKKGVNWYLVEVKVYGESIWSTDFNLDFGDCLIAIKKVSNGNELGFQQLEIPFFQWPSVPLVGFIILLLWFLPYSILKYRAWKKVPGEVDFTNLDEDSDILPPEGIAAEDDDVLDENFDLIE